MDESVPFEGWVEHVFDHEVGQPEWYFEVNAPYWTGAREVAVAYVTRLFEDPVSILGRYGDAQLNQGFWYLVSGSNSNYMHYLTDSTVPADMRLRCIRSFRQLFSALFASRCSAHLSHLDESGTSPLNSVCYMWWDLIPFHGAPDVPSRQTLDATVLEVMESILRIDSLPCQESSLHGLGHWGEEYPTQARRIIDAFLSRRSQLPSELVAYAKSARSGHVL